MEEALREEKEAAGWEAFLTMRIIIYDVSFFTTFLYGNQVLDYVINDYLILIILKLAKNLIT